MDCVSLPEIMTAPEDGSGSPHDAGQADGGRGSAATGGFRAGIWDAIEAGGGGVWELDPATGGQTWSPGHLRLHGLDPAAAAPGFGQWLEFVEPRDRPVLMEAVAAVSVPDAQPIRFEVSLLPASGRPGRRLSCWVTRSAGGDGSQSRVVGVSLDITGQEHPAPLLDALGFCPAGSLYQLGG